MYRFVIIIASIAFATNLHAQQDSTVTPDEYLEYIANESTGDEENTQIIESIELLIQSPVSVNKSNVNELLVIPFLSFTNAQRIVNHRNLHGYFTSRYELNMVDGLDPELVRFLIPLISLEKPGQARSMETPEQVKVEIRSRQLSDIQERRGFTSKAFNGDKYKLYNRLRLQYGSRYTFGVLTEKDPGEKDFADFSTFYFRLTDVLNSEIILGDFISRFGQGLVLWSPYSLSKGTEAVAVVNKSTKSFYPNSSSDENRFFRGAAATSKVGDITLNGFYSANKVDANIDEDINAITSLPETGYHRTDSENDKKDNVLNSTVGLGCDYAPSTSARLSLLYLSSHLSKEVLPTSEYDLSGSSFEYYSVSYNLIFERLYLSGEVASNKSSFAYISNLALKISNGFSAIFSVRNYPYDYTTLYSNGLGEGSNTQNEFGVYTGFKWNTGSGIVNFYYDQFRFPHKTFLNPLPSSGSEYVFNYRYRIAPGSVIKLKLFSETKEITRENSGVLQLFERRINKYRFNFETNALKTLRLKSQLEYITYRVNDLNEKESGYSVYQDARFDLTENFRLCARISLFRTDSYYSRLYTFENDLPGSLTNPALFGNGNRWYFLINYSPVKELKISFKYSELYKQDETSLGSGYSEIQGSLDNKVSLQIDFSY